MVSRRTILKSGVATAAASITGCLAAEDDDVYPSGEIEFTVPYGPAGGFGTYSAALCEYLPGHLPNGAEVVCVTREGAGGMAGMRHIMRAEPDGYTIGIFNGGTLLSNQFFEDDPGYNALDNSWIGQIDQTVHYGVAGNHTPFESLTDMVDYDGTIRVGGTDPLGPTMITWHITAGEMGIDYDTVTGYDGLTDIVTAILREDVDVMIGNTSTLRAPVEDGEVRTLIHYGDEPPEYAPETETIEELGYGDVRFIAGTGRWAGGPPGIEEDRLEILREAFQSMMESSEYQEWAESAERPLNYASSEGIEDAIEAILGLLERHEAAIAEHT